MTMEESERLKQQKAKNLRWKKAILAEFNLESIQEELYDISCDCDEVRWIVNGEEAALIDALDGDEEEAFEFRMTFSDLSGECEQLNDLLRNEYVCEFFDEFLAGISDGSGMRMVGYDTYEEDYYGLTSFEGRNGCQEAKKRLERLTKAELLSAANQVFRVIVCFLNVRYKYDYLKASFDVLKGENTAFLDIIRQIEKEYDDACDDWKAAQKFDTVVSALPDRVWVD